MPDSVVWLTDPMVCPWTCWGAPSPPWRWPSWCPRGSCRWTWPRCVGASSSPRHTAWAPHSWEMYPPKLFLLSLEQSRLLSSVKRKGDMDMKLNISSSTYVLCVVPIASVYQPLFIDTFCPLVPNFLADDWQYGIFNVYICGWADAVCPRSCGMSVHNDNNYLRGMDQ